MCLCYYSSPSLSTLSNTLQKISFSSTLIEPPLYLRDSWSWQELNHCVQPATCMDWGNIGAYHTVRWNPHPSPLVWKRPLIFTSHVRPLAKTLFPASQSTINNWQNVKHICFCILPLAGTLSAGWTGVNAARAVICYSKLLIEILLTDLCLVSGWIDQFFSHIVFKAIFFNLIYFTLITQCKSCRQQRLQY